MREMTQGLPLNEQLAIELNPERAGQSFATQFEDMPLAAGTVRSRGNQSIAAAPRVDQFGDRFGVYDPITGQTTYSQPRSPTFAENTDRITAERPQIASLTPGQEAYGVDPYSGVTDTAAAFGTAFSEQIPFADEAVAAGAGLLSGRGYDAIREQQMLDRQLFNETNGGARDAGGLAGFAAGFALPGGQWVQGAQGLNRVGRAAALGAAYGGLYSAGSKDGGLTDRLAAGARGAGVGAATGGVLQAGFDRLGQVAANAQPSAARRLSREGVSLTPGQMMGDIPVAGPMIRGAEDTISSIPFLGSAVQGARNQGVESFNRAAINRSLEPIGQQLPRGLNAGYDAVQYAQQTLGRAYDDVLPRVNAQLDQQLYDDVAGVLNNAAAEMPPPMVQQLGGIIQNRLLRNVDQADATITGEQFKRIESELSALSRDYVRANDPAARSLGNAIEDVRGALRDMVARQNPAEAQRIQDINRGYANLTRVERAAGSSASLANEGMFTPTQLGQAVSVMGGSRSQGGAGQRLMQDLASAGKSVLPNTIGDSGTAARGAMTALIGGAATGAVSPGLAAPVVAASLAYSKPAQAALNALYRATDRPGASAELAKLATLAAKNPALTPYYESALLRVQLGFPSSRQEPAPRARGLFGTTRPQTVTQ